MARINVGIVTLVDNLNYGNRLQNYAVDSIYKRLGTNPVTLINRVVTFQSIAKTAVKKAIGRSENPSSHEHDPRYPLFQDFNRPIEFEEVDSWRGLASRYNYFSAGSDQIWNPWFSADMRWSFLSFAKREQRIALCPSVGIDSIPARFKGIFSRGLKGFKQISIREESGKSIAGDYGRTDVVVLADPTIMVNTDEWLSISNGDVVPNEPYIFTYVLGDYSGQRKEQIRQLANGRKIITLSDHCNVEGLLAGPAEFIALIAHADAVITDSFHGSVFSMLFDTPLTIVKREGKGSELNSRIETFVKKFELANALEENGGLAVLSNKKKKKLLEAERRQYLNFLSNYFDNKAIEILASSLDITNIKITDASR